MHWNLFSEDQERQLGREWSADIERRVAAVQDDQLETYLAHWLTRLTEDAPNAAACPRVRVLADPGLHSFAIPGGPVYVSTGLMMAAQHEGQFIALLSHQLAHVTLRHTTRAISRESRFRLRAALAAFDTGRSTMMEALRAIEWEVSLGSAMLQYGATAEQEAHASATRLLARAGISAEHWHDLLDVLNAARNGPSRFFRQAHTTESLGTRVATRPAGNAQEPAAGVFMDIKRRLSPLQPQGSLLDQLVIEKSAVARQEPCSGPRERFITSAYSLAYPAAWRPSEPGPNEAFQVSPKGGIQRPAGGPAILEVGVVAGTLALIDETKSTLASLHTYLDTTRPGLQAIADPPVALPHVPDGFVSSLLQGSSPTSGVPEYVWALGYREPTRLIYVLMICPVDQFAELRSEFLCMRDSIMVPGIPN